MKRISYWVLSTVSAVVLLFGFDASQRGTTSTPAATISGSASGTKSGSGSGSGDSNSSGNSSGNSTGNSTGNDSGSTSSAAKTVTGSIAQTRWGPVQVQLTVKKASITKVSILQYPNGNGRDVEIADYSLPILIRETLANQNANIDMVSGATYTSTGYIQSLQSALDKANL